MLIDPLGNTISNVNSTLTDGRNFIWDIPNTVPGEYLYMFKSDTAGINSPCSVRVIVKSDYDLFMGISASLLDDRDGSDPFMNYSASMVVHMNGLVGKPVDPFRLFAELKIDVWDWGSLSNKPVYYSSGWGNKTLGRDSSF